ncbi:hypothetical protein AGOR_G00197410 [Albula goreensis]|uniref:BLUF domain-containing protein n=1 Tax=Albula goreensis TaxID=1534307 RepID=A0A8T3CNA0_9TELE|nr:hypothetical protein AGOR_G00197410 [Albula goreensis]
MEAASGDKKQKGSEEKAGTSLFHHRLAQRMLLNPKKEKDKEDGGEEEEEEMKFLLHRLIVIGRISPELADKRDVGGHYEKLSQHLQRRYHADAFTGLLLLYPSHLVHIVESSSEVLVAILRDLQGMQANPHSALIVEPRVLVVSHDLRSRLFQDWSYKVLDLPATTLTDRRNREPIETLVSGTLKLILKLGSHLLKTRKDSDPSAQPLLEQVPELIVPQDVLGQLLERGELLTPQQYLQAYHTPLNVCLNSGHTFGSVCPNTV